MTGKRCPWGFLAADKGISLRLVQKTPGFKCLSSSELETPEFPKQDQVLLKEDDTLVVKPFDVCVGPVNPGSGALDVD